jgi:hypothetical protein
LLGGGSISNRELLSEEERLKGTNHMKRKSVSGKENSRCKDHGEETGLAVQEEQEAHCGWA